MGSQGVPSATVRVVLSVLGTLPVGFGAGLAAPMGAETQGARNGNGAATAERV